MPNKVGHQHNTEINGGGLNHEGELAWPDTPIVSLSLLLTFISIYYFSRVWYCFSRHCSVVHHHIIRLDSILLVFFLFVVDDVMCNNSGI